MSNPRRKNRKAKWYSGCGRSSELQTSKITHDRTLVVDELLQKTNQLKTQGCVITDSDVSAFASRKDPSKSKNHGNDQRVALPSSCQRVAALKTNVLWTPGVWRRCEVDSQPVRRLPPRNNNDRQRMESSSSCQCGRRPPSRNERQMCVTSSTA